MVCMYLFDFNCIEFYNLFPFCLVNKNMHCIQPMVLILSDYSASRVNAAPSVVQPEAEYFAKAV